MLACFCRGAFKQLELQQWDLPGRTKPTTLDGNVTLKWEFWERGQDCVPCAPSPPADGAHLRNHSGSCGTVNRHHSSNLGGSAPPWPHTTLTAWILTQICAGNVWELTGPGGSCGCGLRWGSGGHQGSDGDVEEQTSGLTSEVAAPPLYKV